MSESFLQLAQLQDPSARGLALLVMIVLLGLALILTLILARWGRNMALRDRHARRREPTEYVDAWEEAGRRAQPPDDEEDDEPRR